MRQDPFVYLRAVLCLIVALGYIGIIAVGWPKNPMPLLARSCAGLFLLCAAIKNIGLAFGVYGSTWFLINELVQATAIVVFMGSMVRLYERVKAHRDVRFDPGVSASEVDR